MPRVLLSPWAGRSSQAGAAPRAERKGCSPALQCSQAVHRQRICSLLQRWLDGARLPGSTSGLPPCSHRLAPLCHPKDAALWDGKRRNREVWLNGTAYLPGAEPSLLFRNYFLERHKPAQNCLLLSSICHAGAGCWEATVARCICQTDMASGGFFTLCSLRQR